MLGAMAISMHNVTSQISSTEFEHKSQWSRNLGFGTKNAAYMHNAYTSDYRELYAGYEQTMYNKAVIMEEGEGERKWGLKAASYSSFKEKSKIWGEAGYQSRKRKKVLWNSTADFRLLYPYVLADTVGGDLDCERYYFSGGCATRLGKFSIGERIRFRADHEYRETDPRPRSVVTDLVLEAGGRHEQEHYNFGINGGILIYKQTNDVSFYQELGKTPELQMSGLGADYKRFSGSNAASYYKSVGYNIGVQFQPNDSTSGTYISASYTDRPFQRILTSLNSLPISRLYLMEYNAELGWREETGKVSWQIGGRWQREKRQGDEIVAGSPSSDEYRKLDELTMFHSQNDEYALCGAIHHSGLHTYTVKMSGGLQKYSSDYVFPERKVTFDKAFGKIDSQWQHSYQQLAIQTDVKASYFSNLKDGISYPLALVSPTNKGYLEHMYESASANYLLLGLDVRIGFPVGKSDNIRMFATIGAEHMSTNTNNKGITISSKIGLNF